jgi:diacylglycerol kinase family enzyme
MAGVGFDARMIRDADGTLKTRLGRVAYVWTGAKATQGARARMKVKVDGNKWFSGKASCLLVGNVGTVVGGLTVFDQAEPDDGWLEVGVVTADGVAQWVRVLGRIAAGHPERSPFASLTRGRRITVELDRKVVYELDGGDREAVSKVKIRVQPAAIAVKVPAAPVA